MSHRTIAKASYWLVTGLLCFAATAALATEQTSKNVDTKQTDNGKLKEVVVVFKTHFDIGYTDMARNVVQRYRTSMIDKALTVCDENRDLPPDQRFVWTIPGWPMAQILWEGQTPDRRQRVLKAFKDGRFAVHALPYTIHTESLKLEDLVRGMGFSSSLSRSAGLELPRDAKMTDVPSHSWVLPTLLKHSGVDFLHLGCNPPAASPDVPMLFWWEGPDGSRLLTMYSKDYGTSLRPPKGWSHATWLALIHTGDNVGPPSPEAVRKLLDAAKHKLPGVKVRIGRMSDFADAILKENPELPVVSADMPDTWIHGPMASPIGWKTARNIRPMIGAVESLNTLLHCWGIKVADAKDTVAAAYEGSLMYGEHTWGLNWRAAGKLKFGKEWENALASGLDKGCKRAEASWDEHAAYIEKVKELIKPAVGTNMAALAQAISVNGQRIVVFNPLPWKRDGVVTVKTREKDAVGLKETSSGKSVPLESDGDSIRFLARNIPAMGYRTYVPMKAKTDIKSKSLVVNKGTATIENAFFRVKLDPVHGTIASLIDKRSGRELVDATARHAFGQYLYERFDNDDVETFKKAYIMKKRTFKSWEDIDYGKWGLPPASEVPYVAASPKNFTLEIEEGDVAVTAVLKAHASRAVPHAVTVKLTLYQNRPFADLQWGVTNKKPETWPEAGWICLPLKVDKPSFQLGRLGSIIDPAKDIVRGSNRHLLCLSNGMTVIDPNGAGVGLCPTDSPCVSLEQPGMWRYSRDFVPSKPLVYINLFNNQWSTNFRTWNSGSWTSRVRLWAIDKYDAQRGLITPSYEARIPLQAATFDGPAGTLPTSQDGLKLSRMGVLVTAFGPNPDGNGIMLRLWEQTGDNKPCRVHLPEGLGITRVHPCDLRGRPIGEAILVRGGHFTITCRPYAPVSLLLTPGKNGK